MIRFVLASAVFGMLAILVPPADAGVIFDNLGDVYAHAGNHGVDDKGKAVLYPHAASSGSVTATAIVSGPGSSTTTALFGQTGVTVTFGQSRTDNKFSDARGWSNSYFTPTTSETYTISGSFKNSDGRTYLTAYLKDLTSNTYLFNNIQDDYHHTGGNTLTIGGQQGDHHNELTGNLTGMLIAGHHYRWLVRADTQAYAGPDGGATASGSASILFGPLPAVQPPEPASLAIWGGLGLVGFFATRRRRQHLAAPPSAV